MGRRKPEGADLSIATRLRILREDKGETQKEIAEFLGGISPQIVGYYESGKRRPPLRDLKELALHYGVTVDLLLGMPMVCNAESVEKQCVASEYTGLPFAVIDVIRNDAELRDWVRWFCDRYITKKIEREATE